MDSYNFRNLTSIIGEKITVTDKQGNQVQLTLSSVTKNKIDGEQWEAFTASYIGSDGFHIPQGTYSFKHELFGEKQLFWYPIARRVMKPL